MSKQKTEAEAGVVSASASEGGEPPVYTYPYGSSAVLEVVTPERARRYLECSPDNSRSNAGRRQEMTRMIGGGQWGFNGDTVKFSTDGTLIDGGERLRAVVDAGRAVHLLVVRGLEPDAEVTVDQQSIRTLVTTMHLRDIDFPSYMAGAVTWMHRYREGRMYSGTSVPTPVAFEILEANPGLEDSVDAARKLGEVTGLPVRLGVFLHYECSGKSAADAETFFERLVFSEEAEKLPAGDPARVLRAALITSRQAPTAHQRRTEELAEIFVRAWNAYRRGERVGKLQAMGGGPVSRKFPEIV